MKSLFKGPHKASFLSLFVQFALVISLSLPTSANAIAIKVLEGKPLPIAAASVLRAEAINLALQGGQDIIAALTENAWTWDYAFAFPRRSQQNDTTLFGDPNIAHAVASADGWFKRYAFAEGYANKQTGEIDVYAETNKLAVAKSLAGVGKEFDTAGARIAALILAKIVQISLDPLPVTPSSNVLDSLDGFSPSGFRYDVGLTDPYGIESELLSVSGRMFFNAGIGDWDLEINDPTNTLSLGNFDRFVDPEGAVTYSLLSPVEYSIPFFVPESWGANSTFFIDTRGGVIAQSVPEPSTFLLLGGGLAGLIFIVRRRRKE